MARGWTSPHYATWERGLQTLPASGTGSSLPPLQLHSNCPPTALQSSSNCPPIALWHRIVLAATPGHARAGRPGYAHLIAFSVAHRDQAGLPAPAADVLERGHMKYVHAHVHAHVHVHMSCMHMHMSCMHMHMCMCTCHVCTCMCMHMCSRGAT